MLESSTSAQKSAGPCFLRDEAQQRAVSICAGSGVQLSVLANGCVQLIECDGILLNQVIASPAAGSLGRVFLRILSDKEISFREIVGPGAASEVAFGRDYVAWRGAWNDLAYRCALRLDPTEKSWCWTITVRNERNQAIRCDAVLVQDIGLCTRGQVRSNELFNSQYLDHSAHEDPDCGHVLMTRQNLAQPGGAHPLLIQSCFPKAVGFSTDGFEV